MSTTLERGWQAMLPPSWRNANVNVCFYVPYGYALFNPKSSTAFGGMEVRASHFARGLAAQAGYNVSVVVDDERQPERQRFGRVTVIADRKPRPPKPPQGSIAPAARKRRHSRSLIAKVYLMFRASAERSGRFPYVRVHTWRPGLLWQVPFLCLASPCYHLWRKLKPRLARVLPALMRARPMIPQELPPMQVFQRAGADVVCCFGVSDRTAQAIHACREAQQKTVLFIAHDDNLSDQFYPGSTYIGPHGEPGGLCHYALISADHIVVQTEQQQRLLAERFRRSCTLIRNPLPAQPRGGDIPPAAQHVLWIGRAERAHKRPELALELARRCPEIPFTMIMNRGYQGLFQSLVEQAPPNVKIVERVPFGEIGEYFRRARVYLSTSRGEGFPNTFLQAAGHGVPILSLAVDPDGFVARHGCGLCADDDLEVLVQQLQDVWHDPATAARLGDAGRRYVDRYHGLEGRVQELASVIEMLMLDEQERAAA